MARLTRAALAAALTLSLALPLAACATHPVPAGLSAQTVDTAVNDRRDALWDRYFGAADLERPEVAIVAYTSPDRLMRQYVACMHDAGYPDVHEYGDGLSLGRTSDADQSAYLALWVCAAQYPVHPALLGYLTADERAYLWDFWDSRTVPCLRGLGFDVTDLGDREEFVDAQGGYSSSPYSGIDPSGLGWDGIDAACPPLSEQAFGVWHP